MDKLNKPSFNRHSNVNKLLSDMDTPEVQVNTNARYRFLVKVGNQYAYRDTNSPRRYELSDKLIYFYSEIHANEANRMFRGELIKEEIL